MNSEQVKQADSKYLLGTYGRFDVVLDHGLNATAYDKDGKKYIDFTAGIGANSLGFSDPGWIEAVTDQLKKFQHCSNVFYSEPGVVLAEKLVKITGLEKIFYNNTGGEANETAIKIARKYGNTVAGHRKNAVISLVNSFHGRTLAAITATGQERFHSEDFGPYAPGFAYAEANNIDSMKKAVEENDPCAIMLEIVQGEGGLTALDYDFVQGVQKLCDEKDIILIIDEVQSGAGRTGTFFAYQQYDIHPDIVTFAKGVGGGLPISGSICGKKTCDLLKPGEQGSTFAMNPAICAGANYVVDHITDELMEEVKKKAAYIREELEKLDEVEATTGLGLMIGVKFKTRNADEVAAELIENGLLSLTAADKVRLLPPLTITVPELQEGVEILKKVLG